MSWWHDGVDYGCEIEDNNRYDGMGSAGKGIIAGYWTQTLINDASSNKIWDVHFGGYLGGDRFYNSTDIGIRPVITISKSLIK